MIRFTSLILACLFLLVGYLGIFAHGGGELIIRSEDIGPYRISVWVNPPEPSVDIPVHYTVGLASPQDNTPILNANVDIQMQGVDDQSRVYSSKATTDQSINKLFYEADLVIKEAGLFDTEITVFGPQGEGEISFTTEVSEPSRTNWLIWGFVGLGVVLLFGILRTRRMKR